MVQPRKRLQILLIVPKSEDNPTTPAGLSANGNAVVGVTSPSHSSTTDSRALSVGRRALIQLNYVPAGRNGCGFSTTQTAVTRCDGGVNVVPGIGIEPIRPFR